ncbi:TlpA family protein disulfide reductase [Stigmatella erecta]|uniref:Thiol-disulfide isomerase or thioredoxin n=1 Tax=Stigmatella erecta TaxID=83460 RepID=A0A1I0LF83_9BACT|nr:TlpA disulfide reductase family protein [Stigmatella erecta]SEU38481.1 Thiol-disulfide isomerase or thioredoxin [Stigmatella erecta]
MRTVLGAGAFLVLAGCARNAELPPLVEDRQTQRSALSGEGTSKGEPLHFEVKRYPGNEPYSVASDRGSVVLLDVWATWCEPCRDSLPLYEQLAKEYGPRGLKVYALNVDEDERAIPAFVAATKVALPILVDANAAVAEKTLKVRMMPSTFLVDRRGVVRFVHEGFTEEFLQKYQTEIEQLLAERAE